MPLVAYQPETRVIPVSNTSFEVKGLTLTEVTTLIRYHLPDVEALFSLGSDVLGGKTDLTEQDVTKLALAFAEQAPGFVANLIALASGETDDAGKVDPRAIDAAYRLPFPTQIKALVDIADITFTEVGGIKKAMESIAGLLATKRPELLDKVVSKVQ